MSTTSIDRDALALEVAQLGHRSRWHWILQPLVVLAAVAGVVAFIAFADLDSNEATALAWGEITLLTWQHVMLTAMSGLLVLVIALPLGVALTRPGMRAAAPVVVAIANIGQAAPAIGILVVVAILVDLGFWPSVLALSLYGLLPVLRNTITGIQQVDPRLVEAGRGMGISKAGVLFRIELPLAVPVMLAGIRIALVLLIGAGTLATFVDGGGLGGLIKTGIALQRYSVLAVGAVLVAALALLVDWLGRVVEEAARPKGV